MATVQRLQTISIIYSVSDHRIYAIKFLDKDYLNNFVQSASGLVDNSAITQSSTAIYWAIQYLNNTYNLNVSLASQTDSYLASQGQDSLIPVYANDGTITYTFNNCRFVSVAVLSDFHESSSGGGGSSVDYTDVLEDINNNLTVLNSNIQNKNNQSDIVDCLNNIFCYSKGVYKFSCLKDSWRTGNDSDIVLKNMNVVNMLYNILTALTNVGIDKNFTNLPVSSRVLKDISDKLANSNDLHTISQAIDLISTAIAQTPTTDTTGLQTELGKISTAVNNIENNPLFELNANVNGIEVCKKNNKNELDF